MNSVFPQGLYAITDPKLLPGMTLFAGVESAIKGGASAIQYRDKMASSIERLNNAKYLRSLCTEYSVCLIINDDLELCQRVKADGVHLGKSDGDILHARAFLGEEKILGVTCHADLNYAERCIDLGVNYCAFGRLFPSKTKADAPHCTLNILKKAAKLDTHIVAIGGINTENMQLIQQANVQTLAMIHGIFGQINIESCAREISSSLKHH